MSDEGEKTCPLCAEEMDLTDQQLKPCKCGYEICVWCWHHIMEMAEKEASEGRCPACRTPYDKERIVGMAAKCERLVAEVSMEKKQKSHKTKSKTSEGRKQLSSVRVIQRNLVYIVGLPLNLADEDVLQRREYFGQYGKVLKVSISRTSAGTIQQFTNNTCSVYITYSKEEEAVRCIQSVHGFILEGRSLRACFGTTKYCHAWLRNVPCSNPDCLYLHEIGSQEDSFTKDEIISAYTRVQQLTGVTSNAQRRSGNVLPPPPDEYCSNSSSSAAKPAVKAASNNSACTVRGSPPSSSSGGPGALPPAASWGARASNCQLSAGGMVCSNGPPKQKPDAVSGSLTFSTAVAGMTQVSMLPTDAGKKLVWNEETDMRHPKHKSESFDNVKQHPGINPGNNVSEVSSMLTEAVMPTNLLTSPPMAESNEQNSKSMGATHPIDVQTCSLVAEKSKSVSYDGRIQKLCSNLSSTSTAKEPNIDHAVVTRLNNLPDDDIVLSGCHSSTWPDSEKLQEHSTTSAVSKAGACNDSVNVMRDASDWRSDVRPPVLQTVSSEDDDDDFDKQRLRDAIVVSPSTLPSSSHSLNILNHFKGTLLQRNESDGAVNFDANPPIQHRKPSEALSIDVSSTSAVSNGFLDNFIGPTYDSGSSHLLANGVQGNQMGGFSGEMAGTDAQALELGESNIISNILSLDLDSWDDNVIAPQNLAKLLGETDGQPASIKLSSSRKAQNNNQSRFSFARQDDYRNQAFDVEPLHGSSIQMPNNSSFLENRDPISGGLGNGFGFPQRNVDLSDNFASSQPTFSSSKPSFSRARISAPPGFSVASRPPPPGFSSNERSDQTFDIKSGQSFGNHLLEASSVLRSPYQASPSGNIASAADIEFMDPAILAVGKGRLPGGMNSMSMDMKPNFPSHSSALDNESRLQLLMQRSLSPHHNLRYTDIWDSYSSPNDAYGFSSRHSEPSQSSNLNVFSQFSHQQPRNAVMSNGHWDGWSEAQAGNDVGIAELLRNDRLGFNKFYGSYEESKFRMPSSGDLYNRSFGI